MADKAAEASLTRENLRTVMGACSVSRKEYLRRAKGGHSTEQGNGASDGDMADHQEKRADRCAEGSSSSSNCALGEEGGGKVVPLSFPPIEEGGGKAMPLSFSPMQEFSLEFERALNGFSWLGSSVRRELVEAARGVACTKW